MQNSRANKLFERWYKGKVLAVGVGDAFRAGVSAAASEVRKEIELATQQIYDCGSPRTHKHFIEMLEAKLRSLE